MDKPVKITAVNLFISLVVRAFDEVEYTSVHLIDFDPFSYFVVVIAVSPYVT
jgi:hypothetical protein